MLREGLWIRRVLVRSQEGQLFNILKKLKIAARKRKAAQSGLLSGNHLAITWEIFANDCGTLDSWFRE